MKAYYNEIEPFAANWLRNLIDAGLIAPGDVDERSILDVAPTDLNGYDRCHFFAGIAGWDYALRLAGWPEDWPVWTGSCPCQPFSAAGRRGRGADERHLWPYWFHLIRVRRPPVIFGEQVASKDGLKWLDLVCADLEAEGYAVGAADLCAAGVGAPHIRQRLWFVAHSGMQRLEGVSQNRTTARSIRRGSRELTRLGSMSLLRRISLLDSHEPCLGMRVPFGGRMVNRPLHGQGWWEIGPEVFFMAHGVPGRVGRLRAAGNAIVPQVAAEFIKAVMEAIK